MVKKYKKESETSYALGATLTMELLNKRPDLVTEVYVSPKCNIPAVAQKARSLGIAVTESEKAFNILSPKDNCYVIGEFKKFDGRLRGERRHVVLVNPSDSGNLGTVIRTVAAFDCFDLAVIRPAVDIFDPKTVRASMGALFDIGFEYYDDFDEYMNSNVGREIVPFMLCGAPLSAVTFEQNKKYSLVFGNEAKGLPDEFSRFGAVRIEQSNKVDSLNLSVAVAIAMYKLYGSMHVC